MRRSVHALAAVALALAALAPPAGAQTPPLPGTEIAVAGWRGGAYGDAPGQAERCTVALDAATGLTLILSRHVDGTAALGVATPLGDLAPGETVPTTLRVDGREIASGRAEALGPRVFALAVAAETVWPALRRGLRLRVEIPGDFTEFALSGSSKALSALDRCVEAARRDASVGGKRWQADVATALLRLADLEATLTPAPDLRVARRAFDVAWTMDGGLGGGIERAQRRPGERLDDFVTRVIGELKPNCPGVFGASLGSGRSVGGAPARRVDVICLAGKDATAVALLAIEGEGSFSVVLHEGPQADAERVRAATDALAQAIRDTVRE